MTQEGGPDPKRAFLDYAAGAFRVVERGFEATAYLSDRNEELLQEFVRSLEGVSSEEELVELLALEVSPACRDVRYELWIHVLQRLDRLLGSDRDAKLAMVLVHLIYGEFDDAGPAWEEARDVYPGDREVCRVGLLVAAENRDLETFRVCLDALRISQPLDRLLAELSELAEREEWNELRKRVRAMLRPNPWFERAARARAKER